MLKELGDLEKKRVKTRNSYLKKIEKVMSPAKTLRFAQVETRLDLALRIELAASIPLVPIEGRLSGGTVASPSVTEGVPGGRTVATYELTASVAAIDKATRKVTLVDAPLTPTLSPSDGAREKNSRVAEHPLSGDSTNDGLSFTLPLSERERAGVRVWLDCIDKA
jgi:hypothetical protein